MSWSSDAFIGKAQLYVERGLEEEDAATRAWWFHFAVEPMIRAMVATLHPVLLAHPQSVESLLSAVGEGEADTTLIRTRGINETIEQAARLPSFTPEVREASSRLIVRRNAECHGPDAEFEDIEEDAWMPDFLILAVSFCDECELELERFVGEGYAQLAGELAAQTVAEAEAEVKKLVAEARKRPNRPASPPEWTMLEKTSGEVLWFVECPACKNRGQMTGTRVHVGAPRFDGDELNQPVTIAGRRFACPYCELQLEGTAQLVAAHLPTTTQTSDYLDPYEALNLDPVEEVSSRGMYIVDPDEGMEYEDE